MPVRNLPPNPNLDHLRYQAKDLLRDHAARNAVVAQRLREFHPHFSRASDNEIFHARLRLSDAQLTIAREYGFPSWTRLKRHIEERGAPINLPKAAALGQLGHFRRLLPGADARERHLALALAAQWGRLEMVRLLLDAGEDPNRYNPVGGHSHTTPLHQAASAGHGELVRLLVERGARLDMQDILWHAKPADWARYAGQMEIEAYLRARERAYEERS